MKELLEKLTGVLVRSYITPRCFEEKLYELLGIRIFKKYLPTSGDLMMRYVWKQKNLEDYSVCALSAYANEFTVSIERTHIIFFAAYSLFFLVLPFWIVATLNLMVNVYPIILQRYNRARIYRILKKREHLYGEISSTPTVLQTRRLS